ncbi:MAG: ABC transporter ATP-binding protein [Canibacter sp.]
MRNPVIDVSSVTKRFKDQMILDGASLEVDRGASYAIVGANGTGKSVFLRLLSGLMLPTSGKVVFDEEFMAKGRRFPDYFGVMIDGPAYVPGFSALKNLTSLAKIRGRATADDCANLLEQLGLDPGSRKPARTFSLGMKQKLGLAQALMESPQVLILDEPFNALDKQSVLMLTTILEDFKKADGTLVFTSHRDEDILSLADHVLELEAGRLTLSE